MNLVLFSKTEKTSDNTVTLRGRRAQHLLNVIKVQLGDTLCVGELAGLLGRGVVSDINTGDQIVTLSVKLDQSAPPAMAITLVLALPRPQMLKRSLQTIACLGVKELYLIHSSRVEKSFWQTPALKPSAVEEQLLLGLEQAKDTILPAVNYVKQWQPFIDEHLPNIIADRPGIVTHPGLGPHYRQLSTEGNYTLMIGPEGGWRNTELDQLLAKGCTPYQLGTRILKVETAVTALLSHFL